MLCLKAYLGGQPDDLAQASAAFILGLEGLWARHEVESAQVWTELAERLALSDELYARGVRARKGEGYRTTKLP